MLHAARPTNILNSNALVNKVKVIYLYVPCLSDISSPLNTHIPYQYNYPVAPMQVNEIETMFKKILIQVKQIIATNSQQVTINCCSVMGIN